MLGIWVVALLVLFIGVWYVGSDLFSLDLLFIVLGVVVLSSVLPYSLEMVVLTCLLVCIFSVLMSLELVIVVMCGLVFFGEKLFWG